MKGSDLGATRRLGGAKAGLFLALPLLVLVFGLSDVVKAAPGVRADSDFIIPEDALLPPDNDLMFSSLGDLSGGSRFGSSVAGSPGYYQTSDYMIGRVAVALILPESGGQKEIQSEDWTDEEIEQVREEVEKGLAWWATLEPAAHLTFTVEAHLRVPTGYEPISHPLGEHSLWIAEALAALGYRSGDTFTAVRDYVNDLRDRVASDWAFAIFVVDSSADSDGRFPDGHFAYAFLGGPYTVLTYDNSQYGIDNLEAVAAHEIGHVFRALDQYASAPVRCDDRAGYLEVKNGNSLAGGSCDSDQPSIMRGGLYPYLARAIDYYARGQIGWWDSDGDGVLDPVDAEPKVNAQLTALEGPDEDVLSFTGQAWQEPVPSPSLEDVTISHIAAVGVLVDAATWVAAEPEDGDFNSLSEIFSVQVGPLPPGLHTLQVQATNSEGLNSTPIVTTTFVYDPVDGALNSALNASSAILAGDGPIVFEGVATAAYGDGASHAPTVALVQFRVDDDSWQDADAVDGQFESAIEGFRVVLGDVPAGVHRLRVRVTDSDGRIESNITELYFQVTHTFTVYVPLVER